jgi:predicted nuclease of predicted toxin-antitoxin system
MAQTKIIVDSNSYFRLAQNIHPFLCQPFGEEDYTLYMHADLTEEIHASSRIRNRFDWVQAEKYRNNRGRSISLSKEQKKAIEETYEYLWEHVKDEFLAKRDKGPSPIDVKIVATALVLDIFLVTDDQDMIELANTYDAKQMTSIGLMKLMLDSDHIDDEKIDQVVEQWLYDKDTPYAGWREEFKKTFKREAPRGY